MLESGVFEYFGFTHISLSVSNRLIASARFEVFAALKIRVATVMISWSFIGSTDVSEEPIASIYESRVKIEVICTLVRTYQGPRCHNPQDLIDLCPMA